MAAALPPSVAFAYLRELTGDMRAGVLLDAAGSPLAGDVHLTASARALLAAAPGVAELTVTLRGRRLPRRRVTRARAFAARSPAHAVVVVCGPHALPGLVRHDLRAVLADLDGRGRGRGREPPAGASCAHVPRTAASPAVLAPHARAALDAAAHALFSASRCDADPLRA